MRVARYGVLLLGLMLTGCTTKKENIPVWLLVPQEEYPAEQYLVAIGEGDTRRAAENSAAAGLARIFESQINATETLSETTKETRGKSETFDQIRELRSQINIDSDQKLLNVQYGEAYTDSRGRVYTAAFLPRAETAEIYRGKIAELAREIVFLVQQSNEAKDPVSVYAFRRAASIKALENDRLLEQLRIIHPQARKTVSLYYDPQELYADTAKAAKNVTFSVNMDNESARTAMQDVLAGQGFSEKEKSPDLQVSGTASFEETDLKRESLVFVRWKLSAEMRDRAGSPVLSLEKSSREGHISFPEARARAERAMTAEIRQSFRNELDRYFNRLAAIKE